MLNRKLIALPSQVQEGDLQSSAIKLAYIPPHLRKKAPSEPQKQEMKKFFLMPPSATSDRIWSLDEHNTPDFSQLAFVKRSLLGITDGVYFLGDSNGAILVTKFPTSPHKEVFASCFLQALGLNTPLSVIGSPESFQQLKENVQQRYEHHEEDSTHPSSARSNATFISEAAFHTQFMTILNRQSGSFMLMNCVERGVPLKELKGKYDTNKVKAIVTASAFLNEIGRIIVGDLLLTNKDRFSIFSTSSQTEQCNLGNLMLSHDSVTLVCIDQASWADETSLPWYKEVGKDFLDKIAAPDGISSTILSTFFKKLDVACTPEELATASVFVRTGMSEMMERVARMSVEKLDSIFIKSHFEPAQTEIQKAVVIGMKQIILDNRHAFI